MGYNRERGNAGDPAAIEFTGPLLESLQMKRVCKP